jgi:hypothetical protein
VQIPDYESKVPEDIRAQNADKVRMEWRRRDLGQGSRPTMCMFLFKYAAGVAHWGD